MAPERHMSSHLWRAYYENDVETFRQLLAAAGSHTNSARATTAGPMIGSPPSLLGTSPVLTKTRKAGQAQHVAGGSRPGLTKADLNWKDSAGLTLLLHAASSRQASAVDFAAALIQHPWIDLYVQDAENGWTALHRAFYFGNISVARLILERDTGDTLGRSVGYVHQSTGLIKVKDREGHGPLDLYSATIQDRTLRPELDGRQRAGSGESDEDRTQTMAGDEEERGHSARVTCTNVNGDQLFTFGSNQNVTLGFGDEDNRQYPERVHFRRPEHLVRRFNREHEEERQRKWAAHDSTHKSTIRPEVDGWLEDLPFVVRSRPLSIEDVHMAKLSSAVLTSDPEANLYMCGHGQNGRLGTGDEQTRYSFVCVEGGALAGKRVATVALGLNHTLALSDGGEIFSWGNNGYGQLGYSLPKAALGDEDAISTVPRQIFGILKREVVTGVSASRIHSVAYTPNSLFTFGKNEGQLGIMDSDARSLAQQTTPRKIAASLFMSAIVSVTAIDKATVCLLENHDVWVFANFGYAKVQFPLEGFTNHFLQQSFLLTSYDHEANRIVKLTGGGDTICALSSRGEVYTLSISQKIEHQPSASTTNPAKIRSAISVPQSIWTPMKSNMAARDVAVDADGSILLTTQEASVWKRTRRAGIKVTAAPNTNEYKSKDYKFSRIPGLTRVLAVRASAHGAYAAVRRDCDVLKTQIVVDEPHLRSDLLPLLSLKQLSSPRYSDSDESSRHRFWQASAKPDAIQVLKQRILASEDIETDLSDLEVNSSAASEAKYDAVVTTSTSELAVPVHRFIFTGRSKVLRRGFRDMCETSTFTVPDLMVCELDQEGRTVINFQGLDILTVIDLVFYLYTDSLADFWHMARTAPQMAHRYRQVRNELMKVAAKLDLVKLESAVRLQILPKPCLELDLEVAYTDPAFFYDGDILVQLEDEELRVHSALVCARCPFFAGLFMGRAGGRWLTGRDGDDDVVVDLEHINAKTFALVLQHIYADSGEELFDDIVSVGLDDFLDTVMDVMSAANELMLDRLSQICQSIIGRHVNVRNVCGLLNAIAPCSVHEFKDAGLEYLCLNLEAMLQGHHLNELDGDLLLELDAVVQANQLACMPFAKSGRAELLLHERHPGLAAVIARNKQSKIDAVTLRARHLEVDNLKPGSYGEESALPMLQKNRRRPSNTAARSDKPQSTLKAKASSKDMMFAMDDEGDTVNRTPEQSPAIRPMASPRGLEPIPSSPLEDVWYNSHGKVLPSPRLRPQAFDSAAGTPQTPRSPTMIGKTPPSSGLPWTMTPLAGPT